MKDVRLCAVWLLLVGACCTAITQAAEPQLDEEKNKQELIYHSEGVLVPSGYTTDRSLDTYGDALCSGFKRALTSLGPEDRWLDIGAGEGQAILDYYTSGQPAKDADGRAMSRKKAKTVAMSIEDRRTPRWQRTTATLDSDQTRYLANKRLREYSVTELGKFQVITDVIGGFSYAEDMSQFMEKTLEFLQPNGNFFTLLQDVHMQSEDNNPYYPNSPYLTELKDTDGSELKVCSWLKRISCVEVTCEAKSEWKPPI